jgi:hypothetical protein
MQEGVYRDTKRKDYLYNEKEGGTIMPVCYKTREYPYIIYDGNNEDEVLELIHSVEYNCHIIKKVEKTLYLLCPYITINVGYYVVTNLTNRFSGEYTAEVFTPEGFAITFETRES